MSESLRDKRFQIHLSTAVVMMFVAGILIWANVRERTEDIRPFGGAEFEKVFGAGSPLKTAHMRNWYYGWPNIGFHKVAVVTTENGHVKYTHGMANEFDGPDKAWRIYGILENAVSAIIILFATWVLCEWLIRWRAARRGV